MTAEYGARHCRDGVAKSCYAWAQESQKESTMSWQPSNDPVLGDPMSCDALDLVIVPRTRDLGDGFAVRRVPPPGHRETGGAFYFFDHFGPGGVLSGQCMDVRPHPRVRHP